MSARKPRLVRSHPAPPRQVDADVRDFHDSESQRVLDAIADALVAPLAIQQAKKDYDEWLAAQETR